MFLDRLVHFYNTAAQKAKSFLDKLVHQFSEMQANIEFLNKLAGLCISRKVTVVCQSVSMSVQANAFPNMLA